MADKDSVHIKTPISYDLIKSVTSSSSSESDTTELVSQASSENSSRSGNDEVNKGVSTSCSENEQETTLQTVIENVEDVQNPDATEIECKAKFHQKIMEYFQCHHFSGSCIGFLEELKNKGFPILLPKDKSSERIQEKPKFTKEDAEEILNMFDSSQDETLLNIWKKFCESLDDDVSHVQEISITELTIFLQIFVASRALEKASEQSSREALITLRKFHEENSELFTKNQDCLPFFAFPFMPNPQKHEVFKVVFTEEWRINLRQKVEIVVKAKTQDKSDSHESMEFNDFDLYEMYKYCSTQTDLPFGQSGFNNEEILHKFQMLEKGKTKYKHLFLKAQNHYHKLIGGTVRIIEALRCKDMGEDYDMNKLRKYLEQNLPDVFVNNRTKRPMDGQGDYIDIESIHFNKSDSEEFDDPFSSDSESKANEEVKFSMPLNSKKNYSRFIPRTISPQHCPKPPGTYNVSPENSIILSNRSSISSKDKTVKKLSAGNNLKNCKI